MSARTVRVALPDEEGIDPPHPEELHQRKLAAAWSRLGDKHALAWCDACRWFLRWPMRPRDNFSGLVELRTFASQHAASAHFEEILRGDYVVDADLADGWDGWLTARIAEARR